MRGVIWCDDVLGCVMCVDGKFDGLCEVMCGGMGRCGGALCCELGMVVVRYDVQWHGARIGVVV